eukprot:3869965-Pyramimonas_sp.AAC.1
MALLRWTGAQAMAKASCFQTAGMAGSVFSIQEVHQTLGGVQLCMRKAAPSFVVFGSCDFDRDGRARGGVATVAQLSMSFSSSATLSPLFGGRVLKT